MTARVLPEALAEAAKKHAGRLAVVDDEAARTYEEVQADAARVAGGLRAMGLVPGERVAFQLPNGSTWLSAFWGAVTAGCVAVPMNPRNRPAEIAYMVDQCEASLLVTADGTDAPSSGVRACSVADLLGDSLIEAPAGGAVAEPDDVVLIVFTSGSTGYPKGAMLSHGGLLEDGRALRAAWGLETGEAVVVPSPLSHVLGLVAGCIVPTLAGATLLTMAAFDAGRALELIHDHGAVGATGTPTHYLMMAEHPDRARYDTSSLRFAMYGGAPFAPEAARRVVDDLGGPTLLSGYGMSETSGGVTSVSLDDPLDLQITTVGRALSPFEVKVIDPATEAELALGEVGELWVRGAPIMKGYWGNPEETARALTTDGWLRTGDLFSIDADGYLRISGRLKEMLTVGGYNVYPAEVERILAQHPAVAEAAVVGAPDHRLGEVPVAFVRLHDDGQADAGELEAFCRDLMAGYKVPRRFELVASFPVSSTGKVDKAAL